MKKLMISLILISLLFALFFTLSTYAILDANTGLVNITINYPVNFSYNGSGLSGADVVLNLNATVTWTSPMNITNVTFIFIQGTTYTRFFNNTINGSRTTTTSGDFKVNISASQLTENKFDVIVEARNDSEVGTTSAQINSTTITFTIDRTNPSVTIQQPAQGETVSAKGTGKVIIDYTPTDTNLGNATYYIEGVPQTSSTSGTTSSNLTSGSRKNTFTKVFATNNNSIDLIVEITDLSGRKTNSSTTTFNVFVQGSAEPVKVFVTPSGEIISTPAEPKGKAITKTSTKTSLSFGKVGNGGKLLSNPLVWGGQ